MRAVIISGGSIRGYGHIKSLIKEGDLIVCADSGYDHAVRMDIVPDAVVGDFDSVSGLPDGPHIEKYPEQKNYTDTEIAVEWARGRGATEFLLLGATGTRLDHTLSNILLLKSFLERGERGEIADEHNRIIMARGEVTLYEPPGTIVSVIPLETCSGVTNRNLEYPLSDAILYAESSRGVSNIVSESPSSISVREGTYLVIVARD